MMGQSASSASLLMIQNWEEWLINDMVISHSEGPRQAGKASREESCEVQQKDVQSPAIQRNNPICQYMLGTYTRIFAEEDMELD